MLKEENLQEEDGGKDDEILLPTIAPATPQFERMVSSSFMLVPSLEATQALANKPKTDSNESGHPGEPVAAMTEGEDKYTERFAFILLQWLTFGGGMRECGRASSCFDEEISCDLLITF